MCRTALRRDLSTGLASFDNGLGTHCASRRANFKFGSGRQRDLEKTLADFARTHSAPTANPAAKIKMLWDKAQALDRLGGDEELLHELCQIFLEESPKLLLKLRQA